MPQKLSTIVGKIASVRNQRNVKLLKEFHEYMVETGASERHQGNELLTMTYFAQYLGKMSFEQVKGRKPIIQYLDSKRKSKAVDPDERWKTTWNDYLGTVKHFFRWLHNQKGKRNLIPPEQWKTPNFVQIKKVKTKRLSLYSESEVWDLQELMVIVKYAVHPRG